MAARKAHVVASTKHILPYTKGSWGHPEPPAAPKWLHQSFVGSNTTAAPRVALKDGAEGEHVPTQPWLESLPGSRAPSEPNRPQPAVICAFL